MKKIVTKLILTMSILAMISISGCLEEFTEDAHPWDISYTAEYEKPFNFSSLIPILEKENVSYEWFNVDTLSISYGKGINNETIEKTTGCIVNGDNYYHVTIDLDESKYPSSQNREEVESRKPLLEASMNWITDLIYNATNMYPISKEFYIRRLYC